MAKKAFTLLEIVFVLGIIAVLLAIIVPSFRGIQEESNQIKASTELAILQAALENYYTQYGEYPADEYDYQTVLQQNKSLIKQYYYDPFGQTAQSVYIYQRYPAPDSRQFYLVLSNGLNRLPDLDLDEAVNLSEGRLIIPEACDDLILTNLKK